MEKSERVEEECEGDRAQRKREREREGERERERGGTRGQLQDGVAACAR